MTPERASATRARDVGPTVERHHVGPTFRSGVEPDDGL
jgi:hypothetical protein